MYPYAVTRPDAGLYCWNYLFPKHYSTFVENTSDETQQITNLKSIGQYELSRSWLFIKIVANIKHVLQGFWSEDIASVAYFIYTVECR